MDTMKLRVGGFMECSLSMAGPVLVAITTKKLNLSSEGKPYNKVGGSIAPLAAISLFLCPLAFLTLQIGSWLRIKLGLGDNDANNGRPVSLKFWVLVLTKSLVHLSAILQMVLAYMIFLLILTVNWKAYLFLILLVPSGMGALALWIYAIKSIGNRGLVERWEAGDKDQQHWWNKKLELSLDLSAAVTSLLFLGLEGLALESQTKVGEDLNTGLGAPVITTFICCVFTSVVVLLATVPPMDRSGQTDTSGNNSLLINFIGVLWALLAISLTVVVIVILVTIVYNSDKKLAVVTGFSVAISATLTLLFIYFCCLYVQSKRVSSSSSSSNGRELKPASLEMTKLAFTAFLAVSLPSISGDPNPSLCTRVFIVTAAMSIISGLGWRFFSHFEQDAAIWTSEAARFFNHLCLAAAAIEFMFMAWKKKATEDQTS